MKRPRLPRNPFSDTGAQRERRVTYLLYLIEEEELTVADAAKGAGVSKASFFRWCNQDPDLMARYEEAKLLTQDSVEEMCKRCALKAAEDPRYQTSMIFWLKAHGWNDHSYVNYEKDNAETPQMPSIRFTRAT